MAWVYVLTDLAGVERSELPGASDKKVAPAPLASMATAGLRLPLDHDDADFLLEGDALLKVYETDVPGLAEPRLHFHGRLITAEEVAEAGKASVACSFAGPFWVLLKRLAGKTPSGYSRGTAVAPVDRGVIIEELIDTTNAESVSGIRPGVVTPSSNTYVEGWRYKPVGEAVAELAATLDGPDWRERPIEYDGGYYAELDVAATMGATLPDEAFEYGDGLHNVGGYRRNVSLEGTVNRVYHLPPGFPDNAVGSVLTAQDAASQAARGLLEAVVSADLSVDDLRNKLLALHIAVRKGPRQVITFTPTRALTGRTPRLGVDYDVGDVVPFRASVMGRDGARRRRIDVLARIHGAEVAVDDFGAATPTLTVVPS